MKKTNVSRLLTAVLLFGLGLTTGLVAQTNGDLATRMELKRTDLSGAPNMEVVVSTSETKPGEMIPMHSHHGIEAVYIIQGATVQVPGKDPITMATGGNGLNLRDINHAGYKNVGDTTLKLFTVHIVDKSKPLYEFVK